MGVISCGTTMLDEGVFENIGSVSWDTTAKTTGFTAVSGNGYFVNTTSGAITVTLPATPSAGDIVGIKDYANTADTNAITIARNGSNIQGNAKDYVISTEGRSVFLVYVDATKGWLATGSSKNSDLVGPLYVTATGGTVTCCGDYKIHTFTGPGTFTVTCAGNVGGSNTVDYLVIAGGGGGGKGEPGSVAGGSGGGGGGGGYRESSGTASGCYTVSPLGACVSALPVSVTAYPITVGGGGPGGTTSSPFNGNPGSRGSNSVFSTITSTGGGAGGGDGTTNPNGPGGSGGGSGGDTPNAGTGNTPPVSPPQGNNGASQNCRTGGGGGGATGCGQPAALSVPIRTGGQGGTGGTSSINATPTGRAGGGAGGNRNHPSPSPAQTPVDGGGAGDGGAGTANTGGGGAGGYSLGNNGGTGGSGIVIIRYKFQ